MMMHKLHPWNGNFHVLQLFLHCTSCIECTSDIFFPHFQFILLGAVPFPADVPRLKELGVCGVVTLNEPYETLVPTSLYHVRKASANTLFRKSY